MRTYTLDEVLNLPKTREFLVGQILPKAALSALVGSTEVGKSLLAIQLAVEVASNEQYFLGLPLRPRYNRALLVATEDSLPELGMRFEANMEGRDEAVRKRIIIGAQPESNCHEKIASLATQGPFDLIVIDHWLDIFDGDMIRATDVRKFLSPYKEIAEESGASIVFLHHFTKATNGRRHEKRDVLGSQSFEAKMRSVISLESEKDSGTRVLRILKSNMVHEAAKKTFSRHMLLNEQQRFELTQESKVETEDDKLTKISNLIRKNGLSRLSLRKMSEELTKLGVKVGKTYLANQKKINPGLFGNNSPEFLNQKDLRGNLSLKE